MPKKKRKPSNKIKDPANYRIYDTKQRRELAGKRILEDQSPDLVAANVRLAKKEVRPAAGKTIKNPFRTYPLIVQGGGGGRPK